MMVAEKGEGIGLSLSLASFSEDHQGRSLNLNISSPDLPKSHHLKLPWFNAFSPFGHRSSDPCSGAPQVFLRGIDVNRSPKEAGHEGDDDEEEAGISSPNSTISSASGKRSERELDPASGTDEHENERASSRGAGISDEEDAENSRKKLRLSKDQSTVLEETFREHSTLNPKQKLALANRLGLRPRQVEVWFQNRRARTKLKQTEMDCELLKRCCENLTEENRRLQREVQQLRVLKLSPHFYMQQQVAPPTTLTLCPSCERVGPTGCLVVPAASAMRPGFKPWVVKSDGIRSGHVAMK
ncbi:hypothetical protein SAY87_030897 [Trapa incisa]|uniref:Homeobox domain-containing protein n=1 Tax=Trapa incisa TaxID=236973 RepID=A0AAN7KV18_9MYRT|nr:hypothetical protein SAY87_030897 [Trapa incisa]